MTFKFKDIADLIDKKSPNMSFIRDNACFIVRHGSMAYGTNIETSDEDFKGFTTGKKEHYLGIINGFEQAEMKEPDLVIYELRKFFQLAANCNPNIIEVLHVHNDDIIHCSKLGEKVLENKELFLSKKIRHTFSGYAMAQLKRIKTHRNWLINPPTNKPKREDFNLPEETLIPQDQIIAAFSDIEKEMQKFNFDFLDDLGESHKVAIKNNVAEMMVDLKITNENLWLSCAKKIGFDDNFIELMKAERAYRSAKQSYDQYHNWKNTRNPKRAEIEAKFGYDTKHGYHLVRLMRMCKEIGETGKVIVKRPDYKELLEIRNGSWTYDQLIDYAEKMDKEMDDVFLKSTLPHKPNMKKIEDLCIDIIEQSLKGLH